MNAQAITAPSPIYTSSAIWHEVAIEKAKAVHELGVFLNESIDLSAFGSGLKRIWFVFIIMKGGEEMHPNGIVFRRKTSHLEIFWRMDYERVMQASLPEFKVYLAEFFIEVLKTAQQQKRIKDFDLSGFIAALQRVLHAY